MAEYFRTLDYRELLFKRFENIKATDPQFSIRKWAEELEMNPGTLSAILNKKRHLPLKTLQKIKNKLNLDPRESQLIIDSIFQEKIHHYTLEKRNPKIYELENNLHSKVMIEWEHYAILYLFDLKDFIWETEWISTKLGLTQSRTMEVIDNLLKLDLIRQKSIRSAERTHINITSSNDIKSVAIQAGHKNRIQRGIESLSLSIEKREFQAHTFAIKKKHLPQLKQMIRDFITSVEAEASTTEGDTLMQLNVQLFPLTPMEDL